MTPVPASQAIAGTAEASQRLRLEFGGIDGWTIAVLLVGVVVMTVWVYRRAPLSRPRRWTLGVVRGVWVGLLVLLLGLPTLRTQSVAAARRTLLVLLDVSRTMSLADADSRPRLTQAVETLNLDRPTPADLDIRIAPFASDLRPGGSAAKDLQADGDATDLAAALRQSLSQLGGAGASVLVVSDGATRSAPDAIAAAAAAKDAGVPVYTLRVGNPAPTDLAITRLDVPPLAFIDDTATVYAELINAGAASTTARVRLTDRSGLLVERTLELPPGKSRQALPFIPTAAGPMRLEASVAPIDGELTTDNNAVASALRVSDRRIRVLLVDQSPRWEFKYLLALLTRDRRVEVTSILIDAVGAAPLPDTEQLAGYDLVILGDVPADTLGAARVEALTRFVDTGGALVLVAGRAAMPWSYYATKLEPLVPVDYPPTAPAGVASEPWTPHRTPAGRESTMLSLKASADADDDSDIWTTLPALYGLAFPTNAKPGAIVLVEAQQGATRSPVLTQQPYGAGQVLLVGADDLWRWRSAADGSLHARLWGQIVQAMALPNLLGGSRRVRLATDQTEAEPGQSIAVRARVLQADFSPLIAPTVPLIGRSGDRTIRVALPMRPGSAGTYEGTITPDVAGQWTLSIDADTERGQTTIDVHPAQDELDRVSADPQLMAAVAEAGGGRAFDTTSFATVDPGSLVAGHSVTTRATYPLWSNPFALLLVVVPACVEWFLRRQWELK